MASKLGRAYDASMHRHHFVQRRTVIYEDAGVEVARYSLTAGSELATELKTSATFFAEHEEFDEFELLPDLTFRIERGDA